MIQNNLKPHNEAMKARSFRATSARFGWRGCPNSNPAPSAPLPKGGNGCPWLPRVRRGRLAGWASGQPCPSVFRHGSGSSCEKSRQRRSPVGPGRARQSERVLTRGRARVEPETENAAGIFRTALATRRGQGRKPLGGLVRPSRSHELRREAAGAPLPMTTAGDLAELARTSSPARRARASTRATRARRSLARTAIAPSLCGSR